MLGGEDCHTQGNVCSSSRRRVPDPFVQMTVQSDTPRPGEQIMYASLTDRVGLNTSKLELLLSLSRMPKSLNTSSGLYTCPEKIYIASVYDTRSHLCFWESEATANPNKQSKITHERDVIYNGEREFQPILKCNCLMKHNAHVSTTQPVYLS